jgi:hypothetical protein
MWKPQSEWSLCKPGISCHCCKVHPSSRDHVWQRCSNGRIMPLKGCLNALQQTCPDCDGGENTPHQHSARCTPDMTHSTNTCTISCSESASPHRQPPRCDTSQRTLSSAMARATSGRWLAGSGSRSCSASSGAACAQRLMAAARDNPRSSECAPRRRVLASDLGKVAKRHSPHVPVDVRVGREPIRATIC